MAYVVIEETADGWHVTESELGGKHVDIETRPGGITLDIAADDQPLHVALSQPIAGEQTHE